MFFPLDKKYPLVLKFLSSDQKLKKNKKQLGHSFAPDAPALWNGLPDDIQAVVFLSLFTGKLKLHLFSGG